MTDTLTLQRLAVRIERLKHTATHGWHPADEMEFRQRLQRLNPNDADQQRLNQTLLDLESLAHRNDPRNPRRIMNDIIRGRRPF